MLLSIFSKVRQISQEIKRSDNISDDLRRTSSNSGQAQDFNIPDVLVNSPSYNAQSSKQVLFSQCDSLLFKVEFGVQYSQFHQWFWNILQYLAFF